MASLIGDYILDNGLAYLDTGTLTISILNADPTTFSDIATMGLGNKTFAAGAAFGSPAAASPNGRKVTSASFTDGNVTAAGTASKWCVADASRLLVNGSLAAGQTVASGNTFSLAAFDVSLPNQ